LIRIPKRQLYKKNYLTSKFLIGIATLLFSVYTYFVIISLSPFLPRTTIGAGPLFHRNLIGSYISFFIPINIISWLTFGQVGGILALIFSCFSIVLIVLKQGILYYNLYIFLFGISAVVGYRIFLSIMLSRHQFLARREALEVDKNTLSSEINQSQKEIGASKNRVQRYAALKDVTEELSSTLDLEDITRSVVEKAFNIIGRSDRALLFLINEVKQELGLFASRQIDAQPPIKAKKGEVFDTWILKQRKPLLIEDLDNDFRFSPEALKDPKDREFKSIIGVPVMSEKKITGVLRLDSAKKAMYTQDDLRLLNIISDLAAVSIENARLYQRTNELAITDGLTGLYVQRYFKERLDMELKRALSNEKKFSMLMIDLDYFKECNDKYGHAAGDILLVKLAAVLKAGVGAGHMVSRYGGEEFIIFLFEVDKKGAIKVAEDIRKKVEEAVFTLRRNEVKITISVGVSCFPDDGYVAEALLRKADENLYKAKQDGRNRIWPNSI